MRHLRHHQIDKSKWDALVEASDSPLIYTASWYLDVAYPKWQALVWEEGEKYVSAIPLPIKRLFFWEWVQVPYFVQQTGLIVRKEHDPFFFLRSFFEEKLYRRFMGVHLSFRSALLPIVESLHIKEGNVVKKKNFLLPLSSPYSILSSHYNENRRRNLRKAKAKGWRCETSDEIVAALEMYRTFQMAKQKDLRSAALDSILAIYHVAKQKGLSELYACKDAEGKTEAFVLFIVYGSRIYYFFGAMSEEGRMHSASSLAFDHVIQKYADQERILDFEGGNLESIGQYFASFGATFEEYPLFTYKKYEGFRASLNRPKIQQ